MPRKYRISIIILFCVIYSLLIEGCCSEKYKLIGNGELTTNLSSQVLVDTITNEFYLYYSPEVEMAFNFKEIRFINSVHALTCDKTYDYEMLESTVKLKCNKDFSYDNELILANSDFLNLGDILKYFSQGSISFKLDSLFLGRCEFENSNYVFYVEVETSDGMVLGSDVELFMNL